MPARRKPLTAVAVVAIVFGLLTIVSGGRALFGGADMGAVVPFVLGTVQLAGVMRHAERAVAARMVK